MEFLEGYLKYVLKEKKKEKKKKKNVFHTSKKKRIYCYFAFTRYPFFVYLWPVFLAVPVAVKSL